MNPRKISAFFIAVSFIFVSSVLAQEKEKKFEFNANLAFDGATGTDFSIDRKVFNFLAVGYSFEGGKVKADNDFLKSYNKKRHSFYGKLTLPGIGNYTRVLGGLAVGDDKKSFAFEIPIVSTVIEKNTNDLFVGPLVGLETGHEWKKLDWHVLAVFYPYLYQSSEISVGLVRQGTGEKVLSFNSNESARAWGFKIEGGVARALIKKEAYELGLNAGYKIRAEYIEDFSLFPATKNIQGEFLGGLRLKF